MEPQPELDALRLAVGRQLAGLGVDSEVHECLLQLQRDAVQPSPERVLELLKSRGVVERLKATIAPAIAPAVVSVEGSSVAEQQTEPVASTSR